MRRVFEAAVAEEYTAEEAQHALQHLSNACDAAVINFTDKLQQWSVEAAESLSSCLQAQVQACALPNAHALSRSYLGNFGYSHTVHAG